MLPDATFGSFFWRWSCAAGQHLARCSSLQQKACATRCHPGLEGIAWKCPSGVSGGHCPPWGLPGGTSREKVRREHPWELGQEPCWRWQPPSPAGLSPSGSSWRQEPFQQHDSPGPCPRAVTGPCPHGQGGWQRCLGRALAPGGAAGRHVPAVLWGLRGCSCARGIAPAYPSLVPFPRPCGGCQSPGASPGCCGQAVVSSWCWVSSCCGLSLAHVSQAVPCLDKQPRAAALAAVWLLFHAGSSTAGQGCRGWLLGGFLAGLGEG